MQTSTYGAVPNAVVRPVQDRLTRAQVLAGYIDQALALKYGDELELMCESPKAAQSLRFSLLQVKNSHPRGEEVATAVKGSNVMLRRLPVPLSITVKPGVQEAETEQ